MGNSFAYQSRGETNFGLRDRRFVLVRGSFCRDVGRDKVWLATGFDRSNQTITAAGDCFDIFRTVRRIAQGLPKLFDGRVDAVVELDDGVIRPKSLADLLSVNQVSAALHQHQQDLERLFLEQDFAVFFAEFSRA